jgi:hypothetical protein
VPEPVKIPPIPASQPGSPGAMRAIVPPMACGARDAGSRAKTAMLAHTSSQSTRAARGPTARAAAKGAAGARSDGQSSTASSA